MTATRGRALIINNKTDREGSQYDYANIKMMLERFGFVISELSEDKEWHAEVLIPLFILWLSYFRL